MNPDIVGHLIDPSGRGQQGSAGKSATKGATVIFCRLAGGDEDGLLALRVLLVVLDAIFFEEAKNNDSSGGLCRWPPNTFWWKNGQR